ncbi:MAG TPA: beta-galactosidase trimerization domain-containing protein [Kiritimatiellia bacterium]|nr:beta-galactosidase trimerization domain-containing protein [Kiritimatiellia bacterium]HPS06056.1 beta-galactosidase trimerization domain-containing protein [Kiritimatiellia bacterium]
MRSATALAACGTLLLGSAACVTETHFKHTAPLRTDAWYRDSVVNIHFDNHSGLLAKAVPPEELAAMFADVPATMLQVSGQSNGHATYPTQVGTNNPAANGYDTLAAFKRVTRQQGKKLCVYMSVDRRPLDIKDHPQWAAIGADGKSEINGEPIVCQRPHRDGTGYLTERFIPQIREIVRLYDPAGFWFDGDYILPRPCWCPRCLAEWKADTGLEAPRKADDPNWKRWIAWHQSGYRAYLRAVAEAIHAASPKALYTSNWSWAWTPEPAPDFADTLSGDVWNIRQVHSVLQRWGAQKKPFDIMSFCTPEARSLASPETKHRYSFQRTLQEGALTMAAGGVWFLWSFNGEQVPPSGLDLTRFCAQYARAREPALGPSESLSQIAVLDSETAWQAGGESGTGGRVHSVARNLAEAHYLTDIVNEQTFGETLGRYAAVIVPEHRTVSPETFARLQTFVGQGGTLVLSGAALRGTSEEPAAVAALLGLRRTPPATERPTRLFLGKRNWALAEAWQVQPESAKVIAAEADGRPLICAHAVGKGTVVYLASSVLRYPDDGLMAAVFGATGRGPSYRVEGGGREAAVLCSVRRKPGQTVLHIMDLSARVNGTLSDVDTSDYTDLNPPLKALRVTLPLSTAPKSVRAVPVGTAVTTEYRDGLFTAQIESLQTHAALILDGAVTAPQAALAPEAPAAAEAFHPADTRVGVMFSDTFENMKPDAVPAEHWKAESRGDAKIAVTRETAAAGRQALKFTDAAGSSFFPFLHRSISPMRTGSARLTFDLNMPRSVDCVIEARNEGKGAGPSLHVSETGALSASGKPLTTLAPDVWHHLSIEFSLDPAKPAYTVTVTAPNAAPQTFAALPFASPWFFVCDSVYFIGSGQKPGRFFLDNVTFERLPSP